MAPSDRYMDLLKQGFMKQGRGPAKKRKVWQHWLPNGEGMTYEGENEAEARRLLQKYGGEVKKASKDSLPEPVPVGDASVGVAKFKVILEGGSIGNKGPSVMGEHNTKEAAQAQAKRMTKQLTPGERQYYRMRYKVVEEKPSKTTDRSLLKPKKTKDFLPEPVPVGDVESVEHKGYTIKLAPKGKYSSYGRFEIIAPSGKVIGQTKSVGEGKRRVDSMGRGAAMLAELQRGTDRSLLKPIPTGSRGSVTVDTVGRGVRDAFKGFSARAKDASWELMGGSAAYVDRSDSAHPVLADVFKGSHNNEWVAYMHPHKGQRMKQTFRSEAEAKKFVESTLRAKATDAAKLGICDAGSHNGLHAKTEHCVNWSPAERTKSGHIRQIRDRATDIAKRQRLHRALDTVMDRVGDAQPFETSYKGFRLKYLTGSQHGPIHVVDSNGKTVFKGKNLEAAKKWCDVHAY